MAAESSYVNRPPNNANSAFGMSDAIPSTSTSHSSCTAEASSSTSVQSKDIKQYIGHTIPKDFLLKSGLLNSASNGESDLAAPLYEMNRDGSVKGSFSHILYVRFSIFYFYSLQTLPKKFMMR